MFPSTTFPSSGLGGPLYHKDQMPEHFHEHFIVTGYRHPKSSAWQCILSLFDATNETFNFWTHFLPSWYFMWVLKGLSETLDFRHDSYTWPMLCFMFACCMFPLASAIAHTFNVMSERARHVCFFLDYSALSLFSFSVCVSIRAYSFPEGLRDTGLRSWYVFGAGCAAVFCTFSSCGTRFMRPSAFRQCLRLFSFSLPYLFTCAPVIYRLFFGSEEEGELSANTLHARQFVFATLSAFLYASHFPERLKPGHFDIIGHSHQLFHVTTILGVMDSLQALLLDMQERREVVSRWMTFDLGASFIPMAIILVVNTAVIVGYSLYLYLARNLDLRGMMPDSSSSPADPHHAKCKCS